MFRAAILFACLALSNSHAVLPLVVPVAHSAHIVAPYQGYGHGYGLLGYGHGHGYAYGHGYGVHGLGHGALGHHIWKRSPHIVAPYSHGHLDHVAVAPVAVSHQSRVDVHSSPAVVAPIAPVVAAPYHGVGHVGAGHLGAGYYGAGLYGAGHYGVGHYAGGLGHYGFSHLGHY